MAAAAVVDGWYFQDMTEAELRQWVEAYPGRVNHRDRYGYTPLYAAVISLESVPLVTWLLENGADANAITMEGDTALHCASRPDVITALLDRGADPIILPDRAGVLLLKWQAQYGSVKVVARLLQDPRVRATVNMQNKEGRTALYFACLCRSPAEAVVRKVSILLQAGANPTLTKKNGLWTDAHDLPSTAPSQLLRCHRPSRASLGRR